MRPRWHGAQVRVPVVGDAVSGLLRKSQPMPQAGGQLLEKKVEVVRRNGRNVREAEGIAARRKTAVFMVLELNDFAAVSGRELRTGEARLNTTLKLVLFCVNRLDADLHPLRNLLNIEAFPETKLQKLLVLRGEVAHDRSQPLGELLSFHHVMGGGVVAVELRAILERGASWAAP